MIKKLAILLLLGTTLSAGEQKKLTFEQAYLGGGERLTQRLPQIDGWADAGHYYQYQGGKLYKVAAVGGKKRQLLDPGAYPVLEEAALDLSRALSRSADLNTFVFKKDGDVYLFLRDTPKLIQVTDTLGEEQTPTLSPDGKKIAYTLAGDLYVYHIPSAATTRLTRDGSEKILNGYASWVYYEEILGRRSRYRAFWWSPDSDKIAFIRFDQGKVPIFPIFRETGIYGELEKQRYPKPGFPNPEVKIGIARVSGGKIDWVPFVDPGEHYLAFPTWNAPSDTLYFQWMNRDQNYLRILYYNLKTRRLATAYQERQKAWVEFLEDGDLVLLDNGDLILRSSRDGWYHIYYVAKNERPNQVTSGEWTVTAVEYVDPKSRAVYFSARKEDSTQTDLYRTDYKGQKIKRLTRLKGSHRVDISPAGKYFIDRFSAVDTPPRIDLYTTRGKPVRSIANADSPVRKQYKLAKVELFRIPTDDGYQLPAVWYLPPDLDKTRKHPVILSIYGGPGAAMVGNRYGRLNNHFLASQGIIVLVVDHRGSGHFGKKGTDLMYRNFGKLELHDYSQAVRYLCGLPFVDCDKIGITGGSYGGYVTALALTKGADTFKFGVAGASVIDWKLYDSVYTERYMDTPEQNPEGYESSSVLSYIDNYQNGTLLINHGAMDDNVHMQNTIQFVNAAIDAGKVIEMMIYPGQRHGYRGQKRQDANRAAVDFWLRKFFGKSFTYEPVPRDDKTKKND